MSLRQASAEYGIIPSYHTYLMSTKPVKHMTIAEIAESTLGQIGGQTESAKLTQSIDELRQAENYDHQKAEDYRPM